MSGSDLAPVVSWRGAIARSDLSMAEKAVAHALGNYMNARGGSAFPSLMTLAGDASCAKSTVVDALKRLEERGFLTRVAGGGRGNRTSYEALIPESVRLDDRSSGRPGSQEGASEASGARSAASDADAAAPSRGSEESVRSDDPLRVAERVVSTSVKGRLHERNCPPGRPEVVQEVDQDIAAAASGVRADAELAAQLNPDAAAADLADKLKQVGAGATLVRLAWDEPRRALAWLHLAEDEAATNPAGFVVSGLRSGEWPSPRRSTVTVDGKQAWVEHTSWLLDPDHAHLIVDEWEHLDDGERAQWHQAVDDARDAHQADLAEAAA